MRGKTLDIHWVKNSDWLVISCYSPALYSLTFFQTTNVFLWLGAFIVGWECVFGISHLRRDNKYMFPPWSTFEACVYEMLTRLAWSVALGWVTISCAKGWGGLINKFLSWGVFQPLAKISYMTYLTHLSVMNMLWNNSRTYGAEPSYFYQVWLSCIAEIYKWSFTIVQNPTDVLFCWRHLRHLCHRNRIRIAVWVSFYASTETSCWR